jgi:pimeloyl-ACP methyl ester carboxylesterase
MPSVKIKDICMYYEIHGHGDPLVIIQGMGVEISSVETVNQRFGKKYRVVAFDSRGTGRTDKPDIPYTIDMMVNDTLGLMDHLEIQKAHIIGISMGSMIALTLAAKHPERVNGLILHVAFHRVTLPLKLMWSLMWNTSWGQKKMIAMSDFLFKQHYPPTSASFIRQGMAPLNFDGRSLLSKIKAPTLILNGTKDQVVPVSISRELSTGISGAELRLIDGDHLFAAKNPDLFIEPALRFLNDVDARMIQ